MHFWYNKLKLLKSLKDFFKWPFMWTLTDPPNEMYGNMKCVLWKTDCLRHLQAWCTLIFEWNNQTNTKSIETAKFTRTVLLHKVCGYLTITIIFACCEKNVFINSLVWATNSVRTPTVSTILKQKFSDYRQLCKLNHTNPDQG